MKNVIILIHAFIFLIPELWASTHWNCIPNGDVIDYADCTSDDGRKIQVSNPNDLGLNFTISAKFPSGSYFEGESNNGNFYGKRVDPDGKIIEGPLEGYYFNGIGKIIYPETEPDMMVYEGEILIDQPNGIGKIFYKENSDWEYMEGIFDDGRHIEGTYHQKNGRIVKGVFNDSKNSYEGYVEIEYKNSELIERFEGYISNGKRNGYGKEFLRRGAVYEGNFLNDQWSGFGSLTFNKFEEGDVISKAEGMWSENMLNGNGTYYDLKGNLWYTGEFVNNKRHGFGITVFQDGHWIGEHRDDQATGTGVMYFDNGDIYRGFIKNGVWQGPGSAYYVDFNETYIGNFIDGFLQGEGELISPTFTYKGPFKKGLLHGNGRVTLPSGESYFAEYREGKYIGELDIIPQKRFKRVALVIGNDNYVSGPLDNAVSDSIGIKIALEASGFEVIHAKDLDQNNFLSALSQFEKTLQKYGPSTEALFYYAGHAVQVDGTNYLNPVDAEINNKYDLDIRSINVSRIFSIMEKSVSGIKIVILDACRNNPFTSFTRSPALGLAQMNAPSGMIISYSTSPGSVALDGTTDGYGFFTGSLINSINTPGLTIEEVFKKTRQSVVSLTNKQQIPWESSSLLGDFYFNEEKS